MNATRITAKKLKCNEMDLIPCATGYSAGLGFMRPGVA